jgi:hypothetical protein
VTEARPVDARPLGLIGHGFDVYQSPEQKAAARNAKGGGRNRGRRRFASSK